MITNDFIAKKVKDSDIKTHKLVAIAFAKSGKIITSAVNRAAEGQISDFSIHAEEFLVKKLRKIKAKERFGYVEVLVVRWSRRRVRSLAKPCIGCVKILKQYGVNVVYYSDAKGQIVKAF